MRRKSGIIAFLMVIFLILAITMPFFARSIFAGHHCSGEHCKICDFIEKCEMIRDAILPAIDQVINWLHNLRPTKFLYGRQLASASTLTSLHVRMND